MAERGRETQGDAPPGSPRLPAGRHGLSREFVAHNQRERIVAAMIDTIAERGYNSTTVAHITKAASVSRRTFYEHFDDKEACFLVAYDVVAEHMIASTVAAAEVFDDWPQQVRAALATLLRFLAGEPELARLGMVEPIAAGGEVAARHRKAMAGFVKLVSANRPKDPGARPLPATTEEALVGGMATLIAREINAGHTAELESLLPDLVELVLAPSLLQS